MTGTESNIEEMEMSSEDHFSDFTVCGKRTSAKKNRSTKTDCYKTYLNNIHQGILALVESANIKTPEDQAVIDKIEGDMQDLFNFIEAREKLLESYEKRFNSHEKVLEDLVKRMDKVEGERQMNSGTGQIDRPTCAAMVKRVAGQQVNLYKEKQTR